MLAFNAAKQCALFFVCLCKCVCSHTTAPHCSVCLCRRVWQACLSCKITLPSRTTCETSWCRPSPSPVRTTLTCLLTRQQRQERFDFQPGLYPGFTCNNTRVACFVCMTAALCTWHMTAALAMRMFAALAMRDCCFANACVSLPESTWLYHVRQGVGTA